MGAGSNTEIYFDQLGEALSLMMAQWSSKKSVNWHYVIQATDNADRIAQLIPNSSALRRSVANIYNWVANASDNKDSSNIRFVTPLKQNNFAKLLAVAVRNLAAARASYRDAFGGGKSRKGTLTGRPRYLGR